MKMKLSSTCHFQHRSMQIPDASFPDYLIIWHGAVCLESVARLQRREAPGRGQAEELGKGCSHTGFSLNVTWQVKFHWPASCCQKSEKFWCMSVEP